MANRTVKDAKSIHGTNPQFLIEKIIRSRIYESRYWKEECFALTSDLVVDKGVDLRYVGGVYSGNTKPSPFLCLTLKLLQLQPEKEIIIEFMEQENFKYIRALGAFYFRLTGNSVEIYKYLEPLYNDYRKLRRCTKSGTFETFYMDEFIDSLLREERVFDVILPRITKRFVLEENGELAPRESKLELDLEPEADDDQEVNNEQDKERTKDNAKEKTKNSDKSGDDYKSRKGDERDRRSSRSPTPDRRRDDRDRRLDNDRRSRYDKDYDKKYRDYSRRDRDHDRRDDRRDRDRDYDRRDRDYDRRDRGRRSISREKDRSRRDKDEKKEKKESRDKDKKDKANTETDEIAEMNALRASLGLKPLKM